MLGSIHLQPQDHILAAAVPQGVKEDRPTQEEKDHNIVIMPASERVRYPHRTAVEPLGRGLPTAAAGECKSQLQIECVSEKTDLLGFSCKTDLHTEENSFQIKKVTKCLRQWKRGPNQSRPEDQKALHTYTTIAIFSTENCCCWLISCVTNNLGLCQKHTFQAVYCCQPLAHRSPCFQAGPSVTTITLVMVAS